MRVTPASATTWSRPRSATSRTSSATRAGQSVAMARSSGVSMAGRRVSSVTPGSRDASRSTKACRCPPGRQGGEAVGEQDALLGGQLPDGEAHVGLGLRAEQAQGQREVHGQLEVDVEELGPQQQGVEVGGQVADVEPPQDGPLHLGPALPPDLVEIGVVPHVGDGAGEPAVAVEQRGGLGDRRPPVEVVLGVEGELDPDVVAPEPRGRLAGPGCRDDQRGAWSRSRHGARRRRRPWRRGTARGRRS